MRRESSLDYNLPRSFLSLCLRFLVNHEYEQAGYKLKHGFPAPDAVIIKPFIRLVARSTCGQLSDEEPVAGAQQHLASAAAYSLPALFVDI